MEPYLLGSNGFIVMPETFGQGGEQWNGRAIGPTRISYGTEVGRIGKKRVISSGSDQCIEKPGQPEYFFASETGVMMSLEVPKGFASVLSYGAGYFRLAIFYLGVKPSCVTALKITHGESTGEKSIEWGHSRLTYNVQPKEVSPPDSNTSTKLQLAKVEPNQRKIIATSGLRKEIFVHNIFQSAGGCYVWIHNGHIKRSATTLSDEVSADFDI
ncbi:hypothetical protein FOMG_17610 [Fusarium oxysporum f. sp. melonis 26406]|uniref:Uncharacterized protein n=1 Tax=Fusarium oxysporum f. sp. melonis 26406 TaxID=1089452 RepID=W9ZXE1_FUSOX|nr:hypothetical protein FOMG_17610 [Fusarium oxysporum f. sp. melonis 26406]